MASPFPELKVHPLSGLTIPWAEIHPDGKTSSSDGKFGEDGAVYAMNILIKWEDMPGALPEILGFSYRGIMSPGETIEFALNRILPWQHPFFNQLYARNITGIKGLRLEGSSVDLLGAFLGGHGEGAKVNLGPWSEFTYAQLTVQFWRPPYAIRSDSDVTIDSVRHEHLRYVDRNWQVATQMLSREGSTFMFSSGQGSSLEGQYFAGSVGQPIIRTKLKRTWYQIPEYCLFKLNQDSTASGVPHNLLYTQTQTINPITSYVYPAGSPIVGCVNSPRGGGTNDDTESLRFFGMRMGTLLYEGATITPRPLHLPPYLMSIPGFANNEPICQVQYDVTFEFSVFDPPRVPAITGTVLWAAFEDGGCGYERIPDLVFDPPPEGGTQATGVVTATATCGNNNAGLKLLLIRITNGGSGYLVAPGMKFIGGNPETPAVGKCKIGNTQIPDSWRGHNLMPFSGNGFWYAVQSQTPPITTPFQYADFTDLFKVIPVF